MNNAMQNATWTLAINLSKIVNANLSNISISQFAERTGFYDYPENVVTLFVSVCGIIANICSILATVHVPRDKWGTYNKLIINLALSDTLVATNVCIVHISVTLMDSNVCLIMLSTVLLNMGLTSTLFNLVLMAVDHYLAIMYALHYRRLMSNLRSNVAIVVVWVFSIIVSVFRIFLALAEKMKVSNASSDVCKNIHNNKKFKDEFAIVIFIFVVLCGLLMIYTRICLQVRRLVRQDRLQRRTELHSYKAIKTTFLILGTFALCWCPLGTYHFWIYSADKKTLREISKMTLFKVNRVLVAVMLTNTVWDPIIYAIRRSEVQIGYRRLFMKLLCRKFQDLYRSRPECTRGRFMSDAGQLSEETTNLDNTLIRGDTDNMLCKKALHSESGETIITSLEERRNCQV
ncbi:hypothetical protein DPMN_148108 [Dreissena polymorpha]|uniref:G-protein coupled receptors family 1 profile domain-containing protein n=1 Tax=Dreissena polymorpha TaxID=45954 RepID=A0A9D4IZW8_DREPO|nr:hypothetical protein DPMN_148108 [Dreissena polymorpha]